jgi:hypothetical protein
MHKIVYRVGFLPKEDLPIIDNECLDLQLVRDFMEFNDLDQALEAAKNYTSDKLVEITENLGFDAKNKIFMSVVIPIVRIKRGYVRSESLLEVMGVLKIESFSGYFTTTHNEYIVVKEYKIADKKFKWELSTDVEVRREEKKREQIDNVKSHSHDYDDLPF